MKVKRLSVPCVVLLLALATMVPGSTLAAQGPTNGPTQMTPRVYLPAVSNQRNRLPNDPAYQQNDQWGPQKVDAPTAWSRSTGAGVVIAIVDSGVDLNHPDLAGKIVPGWSAVTGTPQDEAGHGTHVAGVAAAMTNNNQGIAGMGWDAQIMPIKVLDSSGSGSDLNVANGIHWAVDHGARVINLSLGSTQASNTLLEATNYAWTQGRLVVAASGNCGDPSSYSRNGCTTLSPPSYPAANPNVLGVAATDYNDNRASYSSYGSWVSVAAPGSRIYSTYWQNGSIYREQSGTSMAAPLVSGLAALVWAGNPALTNAQVANLIETTAVDLGAPGRDDAYGYGRVNAAAAVIAAGNTPAQVTAMAQPRAATGQAPIAPRANTPARSSVVLVRLRSGSNSSSDVTALLDRYHLSLAGQPGPSGLLEVRVPPGAEYRKAVELMADPAVAYAEPDYEVKLVR